MVISTRTGIGFSDREYCDGEREGGNLFRQSSQRRSLWVRSKGRRGVSSRRVEKGRRWDKQHWESLGVKESSWDSRSWEESSMIGKLLWGKPGEVARFGGRFYFKYNGKPWVGTSCWHSGEDCALSTGGLGLILGQGTGSHMLQLRPGATPKQKAMGGFKACCMFMCVRTCHITWRPVRRFLTRTGRWDHLIPIPAIKETSICHSSTFLANGTR